MRSQRAAELAAGWWTGRMGAAGAALDVLTAPLEWAFRAAVAARNTAYDRGLFRTHRFAVPVISVGNLSVGGSGKTPVAAWLLSELLRRGRRPALLHGGYALDEPELYRHWFPGIPVLAERNRLAAAALALEAGADVLVLDDAFQHRRMARDLDLLLVSAESWGRRMRMLPRGAWREPASSAARASLVAVTRRTASVTAADEVAADVRRRAPGVPLARLELCAAGWLHEDAAAPPPRAPALAVAAVADPASFFDNARCAGAALSGEQGWRDHHPYDRADAELIMTRAGGGPIVTTEKDWVKLKPLLPPAQVWVLRQEVRVEAGQADIDRALELVLRQ